MTRPELSLTMGTQDFLSHYYLKSELVAFCKKAGLPSSGGKQDLEKRIVASLAGGPEMPVSSPKPRKGRLPSALTLETEIPEHCPCSQDLRRFMESQIPGFHFDGHMRAFFQQNAGRTLQDAVQHWHATRGQTLEVGEQFQYNRHMREYRRTHPGATREEAIAAWWDKIGGRRA